MPKRPSVVLVIASRGYQAAEYEVTRKVLANGNLHVVTASDMLGLASAHDQSTTLVDILVQDLDYEHSVGVFLIGGPGALELLDTTVTHTMMQKVRDNAKPYGAICIAPRILAKAGVLAGKRATGWDKDHKLEEIFTQHGAQYERQPVVVDGHVVTANGPRAAEAFGKAILDVIIKTCQSYTFVKC